MGVYDARGDKLRLINTSTTIGARAWSARIEVSRSGMRRNADSKWSGCLDMGCDPSSTGRVCHAGQDGSGIVKAMTCLAVLRVAREFCTDGRRVGWLDDEMVPRTFRLLDRVPSILVTFNSFIVFFFFLLLDLSRIRHKLALAEVESVREASWTDFQTTAHPERGTAWSRTRGKPWLPVKPSRDLFKSLLQVSRFLQVISISLEIR